jgi:sugar O-acyltransferase (sialic acid O-acetyltransferase NeuD family)
MNVAEGLLILGFGGHARSVADVALGSGFKQLCFIDDGAMPGERFQDFMVQRDWPSTLPDGWAVIVASGDDLRREQLGVQVRERGWPLASLVARSATLGVGARIGPGSFIGQQAHIGPMASVGTGCIINTGAVIEHESVVGDYTHVSVRATVAGRAHIGSHCFIGAGATVIDGVGVVDGTVVGAGACVLRTLVVRGTYVGVPARMLRGEQS